MESKNALKARITTIVDSYIKNYPAEYLNYCSQQKIRQRNTIDKWAEVRGADFMVRQLLQPPDTLFAMIRAGLSDAEYLEFSETKMQIWFGNTFTMFRAIEGKL